jgi:5-methylthioribose kinase
LLAERIGGPAAGWAIDEVGDGNLNLVFLVRGSGAGLCVKQALPYVRMVGPSWPLPPERILFESRCALRHSEHAAACLPAYYHHEPDLFLMVMERLDPHIIMRRGMIAGRRYPRFAAALAAYMARTLFGTSDLALPAAEKHRLVAAFALNIAQKKISEDLIFTDPYLCHERNRWTSPQLDGVKTRFERDTEAKLAAQRLKAKFLTCHEALLHGDLHTGSIMVTGNDTRVIDHEFTMTGPIGFDVGTLLGNLLLNYFAQAGHASADDPREDYRAWVLEQVEAVWSDFAQGFQTLWEEHGDGDLYPAALFADDAVALRAERARYLRRIFADSLGFAGAEMIRRVLGLAHTIDLEQIGDADRRTGCECCCLEMARHLLVDARQFEDVAEVVRLAASVSGRAGERDPQEGRDDLPAGAYRAAQATLEAPPTRRP